MIVAAVADSVLAAGADIPGVEVRGLDGRMDDQGCVTARCS